MQAIDHLQANKYLIALLQFPKFGHHRIKKLKKYFRNFETAFKAGAAELKMAGLDENTITEFIAARFKIDIDEVLEKLIKEQIRVITLDDKDYPSLLKEINDPPPLLYYRGNLSRDDDHSIGVVGSRKNSAYGEQATEFLVKDLAQNKISVISGLAIGTDTLAHETALSNNGRTVAIIGSGLDRASIYPKDNHYLADKIIISGGAILSEFPIGTPPLKQHFPQRNRIIAGITKGTLVIEANIRSGALITARFALDYNREVFAVPGNIFSPTSAGTNELIKKGAYPVLSATDIMEILNFTEIKFYSENKKIIPETKEEGSVLLHLNHEPCHINDIIRKAGLDTSKIISTLTIMEMKGMVKNVGNMEYVKIC